MDIRKLQRVIVDALDDVKAHDIRVFNTSEQTGMFDRVILATGTSNRQTRALASHVREKTKAAGGQVISTEGEETGEWVLVDLGDAVVHIMQPAIRVYYNLEELWGSKPVQIKRSAPAGSSRTPRKAATDAIGQAPAEPDAEKPQKAPARRRVKAPARRRVKAPAEVAQTSEATEVAEATPSEARTKAATKPLARRRLKEPEGSGETVARPKAPLRARKETPSEAPAEPVSRETPDDSQSQSATPKRRAPRKAGLG